MACVMDFTAFEKDIDELLDEFSMSESVTFSSFKKIWLSRKFSYLFEGRPANHSAVFMQRLYSHCIRNIILLGSLPRRIGGLYCLYCFYEIQPFKQRFKIYISLGELKHLRQLVIISKNEGMEMVAALVKRMMDRKAFLFGMVDSVGCDDLKQRIDKANKLHDRLVRAAYDKLLGNSRMEEHLKMDLGEDLDLNRLKKMSSDYAKAKKLALTEASNMVETEEMREIVERGDEVGVKIEELAARWDAGRQEFLSSTGIPLALPPLPLDDFSAELEELLAQD